MGSTGNPFAQTLRCPIGFFREAVRHQPSYDPPNHAAAVRPLIDCQRLGESGNAGVARAQAGKVSCKTTEFSGG
jgi:hypothetical protein